MPSYSEEMTKTLLKHEEYRNIRLKKQIGWNTLDGQLPNHQPSANVSLF